MKRFEQTLDRIDNSLASMTNRVDIIRGFYDQSNMRACYLQTLRLEETAEHLTLFARSLPVYTGARTAPEDVAQSLGPGVVTFSCSGLMGLPKRITTFFLNLSFSPS